jgi:hydrogenase nickel incorporation protein HypB
MEIKVVRKVLSVNEKMAQQNREYFNQQGVFVINVMSSPGSGKTTLLEKTISRISSEINTAVIVGDICTTNDADRLARTGVQVVQVNTDEFGGDCHLAAHVIEKAANQIDLTAVSLLFIENVGNLVCPAEFDIGEHIKVVVMSVTEGEDKPLKYPLMFRVCDAAVLNKIDLLPYLEYDRLAVLKNIKQIHPGISVFEISATKGIGFEAWIGWIKSRLSQNKGIVKSR